MSTRPLRDAAARSVIRDVFADVDDAAARHPSGTRFSALRVNDAGRFLEVFVEEPTSADTQTSERISAVACIFTTSLWRDGRAVECDSLENC